MPYSQATLLKICPVSLEAARNDNAMKNALMQFAKKEHSEENIVFLFDRNEKPDHVYDAYLKRGAKYEINLPAAVRDPMVALGEKDDWTPASWKPLLTKAETEIEKLVKSDTMVRFKTSDQYLNFVGQSSEFDDYVGKRATKLAKITGIKDVRTLKEALKAEALDDQATFKTLVAKIEKQEKLQALMDALENAGLA